MSILRPLAAQLKERYGFEADLAHFAIVGRCAQCVARAPLALVPSRSFDA
jgi:Fur family ferric uptake transcriptional regulator